MLQLYQNLKNMNVTQVTDLTEKLFLAFPESKKTIQYRKNISIKNIGQVKALIKKNVPQYKVSQK